MLDRDLELDDFVDDASPSVDFYECKAALQDLIRDLYHPEGVKVYLVKSHLEYLCEQFELSFNYDRPLPICNTVEIERNKLFQYMAGYTRAYAEKFTKTT